MQQNRRLPVRRGPRPRDQGVLLDSGHARRYIVRILGTDGEQTNPPGCPVSAFGPFSSKQKEDACRDDVLRRIPSNYSAAVSIVSRKLKLEL
jgi:hypothetical protein